MNGLIQLLNNFGLPQALLLKAVFYFSAGLTIFFAIRVVTLRNVFHSAIFLALTLLGIACVYLYLDAEFLAIIQVLIYVGAIVTLFIFAIMLTAKIQDRAIRQVNKQGLLSAVVAVAFLYLFITIIRRNPWHASLTGAGVVSLGQLGKSLMTAYALPFEVISLVLLAALVGAIVIGRAKKQ